jgi:hypothetical protein
MVSGAFTFCHAVPTQHAYAYKYMHTCACTQTHNSTILFNTGASNQV